MGVRGLTRLIRRAAERQGIQPMSIRFPLPDNQPSALLVDALSVILSIDLNIRNTQHRQHGPLMPQHVVSRYQEVDVALSNLVACFRSKALEPVFYFDSFDLDLAHLKLAEKLERRRKLLERTIHCESALADASGSHFTGELISNSPLLVEQSMHTLRSVGAPLIRSSGEADYHLVKTCRQGVIDLESEGADLDFFIEEPKLPVFAVLSNDSDFFASSVNLLHLSSLQIHYEGMHYDFMNGFIENMYQKVEGTQNFISGIVYDPKTVKSLLQIDSSISNPSQYLCDLSFLLGNDVSCHVLSNPSIRNEMNYPFPNVRPVDAVEFLRLAPTGLKDYFQSKGLFDKFPELQFAYASSIKLYMGVDMSSENVLSKRKSYGASFGSRVDTKESGSATILDTDWNSSIRTVLLDQTSASGKAVQTMNVDELHIPPHLGFSKECFERICFDLNTGKLDSELASLLVFGIHTDGVSILSKKFKMINWKQEFVSIMSAFSGRTYWSTLSRSNLFSERSPTLSKVTSNSLTLLKSLECDFEEILSLTPLEPPLWSILNSNLTSETKFGILFSHITGINHAIQFESDFLNILNFTATILSKKMNESGISQNFSMLTSLTCSIFASRDIAQFAPLDVEDFVLHQEKRIVDLFASIENSQVKAFREYLFDALSFHQVFEESFASISRLSDLVGAISKDNLIAPASMFNARLYMALISENVIKSLLESNTTFESTLLRTMESFSDSSHKFLLELGQVAKSEHFRDSFSEISRALNVKNVDIKHSEPSSFTIDSSSVTRTQALHAISPQRYYSFSKASNSVLTIDDFEPQILEMVKKNPVVVIEGETGCGKSSRVPLMLLRNWHLLFASEGVKRPFIVVTQPRRMAAVALARRVSEDLGERLGQSVGFAVGHDRSLDRNTRILFVTTGWLLQTLTFKPDFLTRCSHVVIDEVHERSSDLDLLCAILKMNLFPENQSLAKDLTKDLKSTPKLIVMSATVDSDLFLEYFHPTYSKSSAHNMKISVKARKFPVDIFHLDEMYSSSIVQKIESFYETPIFASESALLKFQSVNKHFIPSNQFVNHSYDIICRLCASLVSAVKDKIECTDMTDSGPSILVFLSGMLDIEDLWTKLERILEEQMLTDFSEIVALHSSLQDEERDRIYNLIPKGCTRIILATNIAETSLTIPTVRYVIDSGLCKQSVFKESVGFNFLERTFVSQASAKQRAGRAGRVAPGTVFRIYSKDMYERFPSFETPELLRQSLSSVLLRLKASQQNASKRLQNSQSLLSSPSSVLLSTLQPPSKKRLLDSYLELVKYRSLTSSDSEEKTGVVVMESSDHKDSVDKLEDVLKVDNLVPRNDEFDSRYLKFFDECGVSDLGQFLSRLPLSLGLGRILAIECILGGKVLPHLLVIISMLTVEGVLIWPNPKFASANENFLSLISSASTGLYQFSEGHFPSDLSVHLGIFRQLISSSLVSDERTSLVLSRNYGINYKKLTQACSLVSSLSERMIEFIPEDRDKINSGEVLRSLKFLQFGAQICARAKRLKPHEQNVLKSLWKILELNDEVYLRLMSTIGLADSSRVLLASSSFPSTSKYEDWMEPLAQNNELVACLEVSPASSISSDQLKNEFHQKFSKSFFISQLSYKDSLSRKSKKSSSLESSGRLAVEFTDHNRFKDFVYTAEDGIGINCILQQPKGYFAFDRIFSNGVYMATNAESRRFQSRKTDSSSPQFSLGIGKGWYFPGKMTWMLCVDKTSVSLGRSSILQSLYATTLGPTSVPNLDILKKLLKINPKATKNYQKLLKGRKAPKIACAYGVALAVAPQSERMEEFMAELVSYLPVHSHMTSLVLHFALDIESYSETPMYQAPHLPPAMFERVEGIKKSVQRLLLTNFFEKNHDLSAVSTAYSQLIKELLDADRKHYWKHSISNSGATR